MEVWIFLVPVALTVFLIRAIMGIESGMVAGVEHVFLWRIDDHHHGSLTVYPDKETYLKFKADLEQARDNVTGVGITMVDSNEGPLLGQI